jgi:hypothetical protein
MSRWHDDPEDIERRIARALIVGAYTDVSACEYLGRVSGWD